MSEGLEQDQVIAKLHRMACRIFTLEIDPDVNLFLQCGDSVLHMSYATAIQDEFDVHFTLEEYHEHTTIRELSELVMKSSILHS